MVQDDAGRHVLSMTSVHLEPTRQSPWPGDGAHVVWRRVCQESKSGAAREGSHQRSHTDPGPAAVASPALVQAERAPVLAPIPCRSASMANSMSRSSLRASVVSTVRRLS